MCLVFVFVDLEAETTTELKTKKLKHFDFVEFTKTHVQFSDKMCTMMMFEFVSSY